MKDLFQLRYTALIQAWQRGLARETAHAGAAFVIVAVFFYAACLLLPQVREALVGLVLSVMGSMPITQEDGTLSALGLLSNNLQACAFIMVYGLIPFLRLPALTLGINAMVLGVLAAQYTVERISLFVYLALLLPHGIFELPAITLALGTGLYVCTQLTRRCRKQPDALPLWDCLLLIHRGLLLAVLPLLCAAALMEAYVTPLLASLFL